MPGRPASGQGSASAAPWKARSRSGPGLHDVGPPTPAADTPQRWSPIAIGALPRGSLEFRRQPRRCHRALVAVPCGGRGASPSSAVDRVYCKRGACWQWRVSSMELLVVQHPGPSHSQHPPAGRNSEAGYCATRGPCPPLRDHKRSLGCGGLPESSALAVAEDLGAACRRSRSAAFSLRRFGHSDCETHPACVAGTRFRPTSTYSAGSAGGRLVS
mmetsp:Transcript_36485/g.85464  ORF Transcript_36485/g.85464 Transcript_36485/m.85464 type:complete len:215 (-) Transcript_36485:55-699(-)